MTKNLKTSFILYLTYFAIIIAFSTLANFFSGVGVNFVALVGIIAIQLLIFFSDSFVKSRTRDLLVVSAVFAVFEFIIYFVVEFGIGNFDSLQAFAVVQHILSFLSILFFAYTIFRLIMESKDIHIKFIEILLGNDSRAPREKKVKELDNGSLEDKPNHLNKYNDNTSDDHVIIDEHTDIEE